MTASRGEPDGETERRILAAARNVFVRRGTAGARMQEIAEEAGVNQALLHYYFRSKDGLAAAVFREAAARLMPAALQLLASDVALEAKIERFVHLYIDSVRQNPFVPGYILAELHHHPERVTALVAQLAGGGEAPMARRVLGRLDEQLREAASAGRMRPMSAEQLFVSLLALTVFPFAARPLLHAVLGLDEAAFSRFLDERRADLPRFVLDALRPSSSP